MIWRVSVVVPSVFLGETAESIMEMVALGSRRQTQWHVNSSHFFLSELIIFYSVAREIILIDTEAYDGINRRLGAFASTPPSCSTPSPPAPIVPRLQSEKKARQQKTNTMAHKLTFFII